MNDLKELVEMYAHAKQATRYCLDHDTGLVDMHGLAYWAGKVEELRKQIKEKL